MYLVYTHSHTHPHTHPHTHTPKHSHPHTHVHTLTHLHMLTNANSHISLNSKSWAPTYSVPGGISLKQKILALRYVLKICDLCVDVVPGSFCSKVTWQSPDKSVTITWQAHPTNPDHSAVKNLSIIHLKVFAQKNKVKLKGCGIIASRRVVFSTIVDKYNWDCVCVCVCVCDRHILFTTDTICGQTVSPDCCHKLSILPHNKHNKHWPYPVTLTQTFDLAPSTSHTHPITLSHPHAKHSSHSPHHTLTPSHQALLTLNHTLTHSQFSQVIVDLSYPYIRSEVGTSDSLTLTL